ncbi:MAG: hypothetical protein BGO51_08035 [Rhodospirillales bacterium 69-11]|nr:MAG: hypothetical protein BGO51_08035 [Rhodospirillales bacterium 69-11]
MGFFMLCKFAPDAGVFSYGIGNDEFSRRRTEAHFHGLRCVADLAARLRYFSMPDIDLPDDVASENRHGMASHQVVLIGGSGQQRSRRQLLLGLRQIDVVNL